MVDTEELKDNVDRIQTLSDTDGIFYAPIDVSLHVTERIELPSLIWYNYDIAPKKMKITNTAHTVILSAKWMQERPFLSNGPLVGNYVFSQLHFHWGPTNDEGSEHTAEGKNFPLEMHVVHFKSTYGTQEVALREKDGLSVIIYFYKIQNEDNPSLEEIIDTLSCIESPHTSVHIDLKPITHFLRPFDSDYFLYWGSVMTSTCSHRILWLVSREPIGISTRQVARFRLLKGADDMVMTNNYRQVQPLNNRCLFHVSPSSLLSTTILPIPTTPSPNIIKRGPGYLLLNSESTKSESLKSEQPNQSLNASTISKNLIGSQSNPLIYASTRSKSYLPNLSPYVQRSSMMSEQQNLSQHESQIAKSLISEQLSPSIKESTSSKSEQQKSLMNDPSINTSTRTGSEISDQQNLSSYDQKSSVMNEQQNISMSESQGSNGAVSEEPSISIKGSTRSKSVKSEQRKSTLKDPSVNASIRSKSEVDDFEVLPSYDLRSNVMSEQQNISLSESQRYNGTVSEQPSISMKESTRSKSVKSGQRKSTLKDPSVNASIKSRSEVDDLGDLSSYDQSSNVMSEQQNISLFESQGPNGAVSEQPSISMKASTRSKNVKSEQRKSTLKDPLVNASIRSKSEVDDLEDLSSYDQRSNVMSEQRNNSLTESQRYHSRVSEQPSISMKESTRSKSVKSEQQKSTLKDPLVNASIRSKSEVDDLEDLSSYDQKSNVMSEQQNISLSERQGSNGAVSEQPFISMKESTRSKSVKSEQRKSTLKDPLVNASIRSKSEVDDLEDLSSYDQRSNVMSEQRNNSLTESQRYNSRVSEQPSISMKESTRSKSVKSEQQKSTLKDPLVNASIRSKSEVDDLEDLSSYDQKSNVMSEQQNISLSERQGSNGAVSEQPFISMKESTRSKSVKSEQRKSTLKDPLVNASIRSKSEVDDLEDLSSYDLRSNVMSEQQNNSLTESQRSNGTVSEQPFIPVKERARSKSVKREQRKSTLKDPSVNASIRSKSEVDDLEVLPSYDLRSNVMSEQQNISLSESQTTNGAVSEQPSISIKERTRSKSVKSEQQKSTPKDPSVNTSIKAKSEVDDLEDLSSYDQKSNVMSEQQNISLSESQGFNGAVSEQSYISMKESAKSKSVISEQQKSSLTEKIDSQPHLSFLQHSFGPGDEVAHTVVPSVSFSEKKHIKLISSSDHPCSASSQLFSDDEDNPLQTEKDILESYDKTIKLPSIHSSQPLVHVFEVSGLSVATQMPSIMKNVISCFDAGSQHISLRGAEDSECELITTSFFGKENCWPYKPVEDGTKFQSPVDINPEEVPGASFLPLTYNNYWTDTIPLLLTNNGYTAEIKIHPDQPHPYLRGGPLQGDYAFEQLHFHWGPYDSHGCEHKVKGQSAAMEVHLVHYRKELQSLERASEEPDGIAVLAFLLRAGEEDNSQFDSLCCNLKKIECPFTSTEITSNALHWLKMYGKSTGYYTYPGSLTMPVYSKTVTWIVYPDTIEISHRQVNDFRKLQEGYHYIKHNYRPVQPINSRPIFFSK